MYKLEFKKVLANVGVELDSGKLLYQSLLLVLYQLSICYFSNSKIPTFPTIKYSGYAGCFYYNYDYLQNHILSV